MEVIKYGHVPEVKFTCKVCGTQFLESVKVCRTSVTENAMRKTGYMRVADTNCPLCSKPCSVLF